MLLERFIMYIIIIFEIFKIRLKKFFFFFSKKKVYLKAKSNETQANVKASLQQILEIVFQVN